MKGDIEILGRKVKELNLEMKLQNEELQKVTRESSQKKESEKFLIQEKAKVGSLEKELLKSNQELQSKNVLLNEYKLSMADEFGKLSIFQIQI